MAQTRKTLLDNEPKAVVLSTLSVVYSGNKTFFIACSVLPRVVSLFDGCSILNFLTIRHLCRTMPLV